MFKSGREPVKRSDTTGLDANQRDIDKGMQNQIPLSPARVLYEELRKNEQAGSLNTWPAPRHGPRGTKRMRFSGRAPLGRALEEDG